MKTSAIKLGIITMLLLFTAGTAMAASLQIVSVEPEKIHAGKKTTITVTIRNDSDLGCRVTLEPSAPKGCSLKSLQPDIVSVRGFYTPTVPAKGSFDAKFELSFTEPNLSGGIPWTIKEYGRVYDGPQLDAKAQTIVPKVGKDYWENKFRNMLTDELANRTGAFRTKIEKLYNLYRYDNGSVESASVTPLDRSSDFWEDGYNISQMQARLVFNWHREVPGTQLTPPVPVPYTRNCTKFTVTFNIDPNTSSPSAPSISDIEDTILTTADYTALGGAATVFTALIKALLVLAPAAAAGS